MSQKQIRVAGVFVLALAALTFHSAAVAQMAPAPEGPVPPPTIDTNEDGKLDAWDRDGNGIPDAWDVNGDGKPDRFDNNGDGKPDDPMEKKSKAE